MLMFKSAAPKQEEGCRVFQLNITRTNIRVFPGFLAEGKSEAKAFGIVQFIGGRSATESAWALQPLS